MRDFLFDFRSLQNFGLQRRCEMFRARFGARLGKTRLAKLYRAEGCSYSLPKRKYTREYQNRVVIHQQRLVFARQLKDLLDSCNRIVYADESSFGVIMKPLRCWQHPSEPLDYLMTTRRPPNLTLFGAVSAQISRPVFFLGSSTNQHDMVRFLRHLRNHITQLEVIRQPRTILIVDNHASHRANSVARYIEEDFQETGHRFVLTFQPTYSCGFNSQEQVWAMVKRRFRLLLAKITVDLNPEQFGALIQQAAYGCQVDPLKLSRANAVYLAQHL